MKISAGVFCVLAVAIMVAAMPTPVQADASGLISMLTSQLGVTTEQAEGGSGAILSYAKGQLSEDDYSKVTEAMPETEDLVDSAPKKKEGGLASQLGGASSLLGGGDKGASVTGMAGLAESFSSLGLSSDMIGQFTPVILEYAKGKGGETVSTILGSVLKGL
jgi:hypothetical protein